MDILLEASDYYVFDKVYAKLLPKTNNNLTVYDSNYNFGNTFNLISSQLSKLQTIDEVYGMPKVFPATEFIDASWLCRSNIVREFLTMTVLLTIAGWLAYFSVATLAYFTIFDKKIFNHPRYLKNQISLEIHRAFTAIPVMVLLTVPLVLLELKGYSKLHGSLSDVFDDKKLLIFQSISFIMFTDCGIYFIHRWLHVPWVYKLLHKPHHKWIVCTPFASHAFHPVDGWFQSLPYHLYPLLFPLHKVLYLGLFTFVNFWTVMIHDGAYFSNDPVVNGTACHTVHHLYFNYNYGQFTTLWDRLGRSYRRPDDSLFIRNNKEEKKQWDDQVKGMEEIRIVLEGKDDRSYS
ncbi:delta(7)-sterol 5(6)-desaturase [[Candida] jaroonii]|uniref:Delta(7)-sterol 5(6)-desaturase n=1 Tax=[Candida] jaroonii TaxID=467808 RepID=A0ACA9Y9B6_9ASCO|nr:delta(7)-sterol 5(6)-desaturase [[Candida] jaroonii]